MRTSRLGLALRRALRDPLTVACLVVLLALIVATLVPQLIAPYNPNAISPANRLRPPSGTHFFGTDHLGRDLFSRVVYGVRISLGAAVLVVAAAAAVGTIVGLLAAFFRGWVEEVSMRLADLLLAFPQLVVAMAIVAFFGPSLQNAMLAIVIVWWPQYARLVRGQAIVVMAEDYVQAAKALGARAGRIQWRHVLPNCFGPVLVRLSLDIGTALLLTASLSFLGLGASPPTHELGALVNEGRDHLMTSWWYATFPGLTILLLVLALNLLGDAVHDVLDPTAE